MPEFINKKYKTSSECVSNIKRNRCSILPGSDFGFKPNKMLARLSYTDFDGSNFLKISNDKITNDDIEKYAPNVVEGYKIYQIGLKIYKILFDLHLYT